MIVGQINADLDVIVPLEVNDRAGQLHQIEAVLDTGFNGGLTLSPSLIASLGLPFRTQSTAVLSDGTVQIFDV
jgi:predicted aspartyl protease